MLPGEHQKRKQSTAFVGPVVRSLAKVDETMQRGGPQASREWWRVGFPVALGGRIATFFTPLAPKQRGVAAVLTMAAVVVTAIGFFGASIFTSEYRTKRASRKVELRTTVKEMNYG